MHFKIIHNHLTYILVHLQQLGPLSKLLQSLHSVDIGHCPLPIVIKFSTNSTITEKVSIEAASRENVIELGHQLDEKMIEVEPQRNSMFVLLA